MKPSLFVKEMSKRVQCSRQKLGTRWFWPGPWWTEEQKMREPIKLPRGLDEKEQEKSGTQDQEELFRTQGLVHLCAARGES